MKSLNQKPYIQSIFIEQQSAEHPPHGTVVFVADHNVTLSIKLSPGQCDQVLNAAYGAAASRLDGAITNLGEALE